MTVRPRIFWVGTFWLAGGLVLAGCASLPAVDADIVRANLTADPRGAIDLMRRQDERIAKRPFVGGNAVRLLRNGGETYAAMTEAIVAARRRIDMESYTFDEAEGGKFADLLIAKRAQGVEVDLIYDAWGSSATPAALFTRLKQGGVNVLEYHPLSNPLDLNDRDHRKLLVVDAAVAIVGGVNVSAVYDNRRKPGVHDDDPEQLPWRDTDVRIQGPAAADFERIFLETWTWNKGTAIPPPPLAPKTRYGDALIQAIDGDPNDDHPMIYRTLLVSITLARKSILMTTGFFVPTPDLAHALERAARRGVDVELIVPAHSDSQIAIDAGRASYAALLAAGVHIYERLGVVLHAKTAVFDGTLSIVGSSNLDWRSVVFNTEDDAVIIDTGFAQQMESLFQSDVAASRAIDPAQWADRPVGERVREWGARLVQIML